MLQQIDVLLAPSFTDVLHTFGTGEANAPFRQREEVRATAENARIMPFEHHPH